MLLFGHVGLTLGAVGILDRYFCRKDSLSCDSDEVPLVQSSGSGENWIFGIIKRPIDYRLVMLGAMLPDIIDKPIGALIFRDTFNNGRIFAHTLLFALILMVVGLYLRKRGRTGMLVVAFCSAWHLVLDSMWGDLTTLFWPLYGWKFRECELGDWIPGMIESLWTKVGVGLPEMVGLVVVVGVFAYLLRKKQLWIFARTGNIRGRIE